MTECHRAQTTAELNVLVAVEVPHPASGAALDHRRHSRRILIVALGAGMGAARNEAVNRRLDDAKLLMYAARVLQAWSARVREPGRARRTGQQIVRPSAAR
jgi:hypothetical protein